MFHIHNNEYNNSPRGAFLDKTAFLQQRKKAKGNLCSLIKTALKEGWSTNHYLSVVRVIKKRTLPWGIWTKLHYSIKYIFAQNTNKWMIIVLSLIVYTIY